MNYEFSKIEKKWQKVWEDEQTFKAEVNSKKEKWYGLVEFPYPSAQGLHVGHPRSYTAVDIIARKRRLQGYNVLFPIGWDAFGLPTENYAIKNKIHPSIVTKDNIDNFRRQLKALGFSFDWSREVSTTDPEYYKWTQWIFVQLFKKGLAYKTTMPINFCTGCKVGLSNEEVVGGVCERCGSDVIQKEKSQWMLKITEYSERLISDLDTVDFLEKIKAQQINWIGKSTGAEVKFKIDGIDEELLVYTTRADTLFGATYMVVAPEHPIIQKLKNKITNLSQIEEYSEKASHKSEFERTELAKDKTGIEIKGIKAINPLTNEAIPIWVSDYVLITYGTGAIMAVPAHDDRDFEFAKKFNLPIKQVITTDENVGVHDCTQDMPLKEAYVDIDNGVMINSGFLNGLPVKSAITAAIKHVEEKGFGISKTNYKLRDWVFSRQRYWGEPIPVVHCEKCGWVHIPENELPLILPEIEDFEPTGDGDSPLSKLDSWINTTCPTCGGSAKRETDTMPQWAGSSWYFLRYIDPHNSKEIASVEALKHWLPIDWYNGGMEHTTLHLLYSRFWHKFLYDIGIVPTAEPYAKRTSQGMILGENSEKMSKSRGNVINPDDLIRDFGADTTRTYEMFLGAFDQATPWSQNGVKGCYKFLERVWNLQEILVDGKEFSEKLESLIHKTIKKVTQDIEHMKFNTAISALMILLNAVNDIGEINKAEFKIFLTLLNPFAPHITEELWNIARFENQITNSVWPKYDESKTIDQTIEIPVQINGKLRTTVNIELDSTEAVVKEIVHKDDIIADLLNKKTIVKEIYVKNKIYNIVIK